MELQTSVIVTQVIYFLMITATPYDKPNITAIVHSKYGTGYLPPMNAVELIEAIQAVAKQYLQSC